MTVKANKINVARFGIAAISGLLLAAAAQPVYANELDDNKVVVDQMNRPITSIIHETCVRTKWETPDNTNPCAAPKPPQRVAQAAPQPQYTPARELSRADRTVYFAFDSARLDSESQARLDNLASALKNSGDVRHASIVGYADQIGTNDYNVRLSERRAKAVQDYLSNQGYINTRVAETRGLGETNSVTQCESKNARGELISCLAPDRRVEVEVTFMKDKMDTRYPTRRY